MKRLLPLVLFFGCGAELHEDEHEEVSDAIEVFSPGPCATPAAPPTAPITGGVSLPGDARLVLPFAAGAKVLIISGYSSSGGSSLHATTQRAWGANDYYALDLSIDRQDRGLGEPILAPFDGEVVRSGWATAGWANYGLRVLLRHNLGDGHTYTSIYAHLNEIDPAIVEGARVSRGQRLGTLGRSCQRALRCNSFSTPHLHFAVHRDSSIGGSGTGGSYGGRAVVPEPIEGVTRLRRGQVLTSHNDGSACGSDEPAEPPPPPQNPCQDKLNGLWCDGNDLVLCRNDQVTSRQTCVRGCQSMPIGVNDRCR